jgi:putative membrane protein
VTIPKGINAGKDPTIGQLAHLKGSRFDSQFARAEVAAHQRAIEAFKQEAAHGQDADVKDYASKMIPVLEKHLHLAEECAKPVKRS